MEVRRTSWDIMHFLMEVAVRTGTMRGLRITDDEILKDLGERGVHCTTELLKVCMDYLHGAGYASFGESAGIKITSAGVDFAEKQLAN